MKLRCFTFLVLGILPMLYCPYTAVAQLSTFAVLGGSTVTNTGPTIVTGNLGVSAGSAVTGFPPGIVITGTIHAADAVAAQAQSDLTTLYTQLAGTACNTNLTGQDLGTLAPLIPGVYCFDTSAQLTGTLTLDAQNNPNAIFLFKIGSTLTTASNSIVRLINSTSNCGGVLWQVGSSATLGTGTTLIGSIVALTSITLTTGASMNGRVLARNGAVTLDTSPVTVCSAALVGPGLPPSATGAPAMSVPALAGLALLLAGLGSVLVRKAQTRG